MHLDDRPLGLVAQAVGQRLVGEQLLQCGFQGQSALDRVAVGAGEVIAAQVDLDTRLARQQHQAFVQRQGRYVEVVVATLGLHLCSAVDRAGLHRIDGGGVGGQREHGELDAQAQSRAICCLALLVVLLHLQNRPH